MVVPLAILGGGQLGRMTLQAASRLGLDVLIAERFADSPAARMTSKSIVFPNGWDDKERLDELAEQAKVVTLESEFVDWRVLDALEQRGVSVRPTPACVGVVQDKLLQKQALARAELPVPTFAAIDGPQGLETLGSELGWPLMLKARRDGYDGHGNVVVHGSNRAEAEAACKSLGWPDRSLYAEAFIEFERELACMAVRDLNGNIVMYPVVETIQDPTLHICREVLAPAHVAPDVARRASEIAKGAIEAIDGLGALGVEMFLMQDGQVVINELAPRPHNSGHYSIEACWTSQFENHVRAVLGMPLGDPSLRAPAAVMVNLLGSCTQPIVALNDALAEPHAFVHLYGKDENRLGRKMGHVTAIADSLEEARERAIAAASRLRV